MRFWREWRAERATTASSAAFARALFVEPDADAVGWLAALEPAADADHARWELRYARRAAGMLVAERDALDDRTASLVAAALTGALARDPQVAPGMNVLVERQFNERLRAYSDAARRRTAEPVAVRLGRTLLGFTGIFAPSPPDVARATGICGSYLDAAGEELRQRFGIAQLPEHHAPSSVQRRR